MHPTRQTSGTVAKPTSSLAGWCRWRGSDRGSLRRLNQIGDMGAMRVGWPRLATVLGALSVSVIAWAEPRWWMKKEDPNSLYLFHSQNDDCPASFEAAASGAFVRARIKRKESWTQGELALTVDVQCVEIKPSLGFAFSTEIYFGRFAIDRTVAGGYQFMLFSHPRYGSTGVASDPRMIRDEVRDSVERALTDYLKANFDL